MAFAGMMQNKKISVAPSAILMDFPSAELGRALHPRIDVMNLTRLALEACHDSHFWIARLGSDRSSRTAPARVVIAQASAPIGTAHAFNHLTSKADKRRCRINASATTWMR